jgi:hypothetical protein
VPQVSNSEGRGRGVNSATTTIFASTKKFAKSMGFQFEPYFLFVYSSILHECWSHMKVKVHLFVCVRYSGPTCE